MLCDGMGYDNVVAGVAVVLRLVERETGIGVGRVATQRQELYTVVLFNRGEHLLRFSQTCYQVDNRTGVKQQSSLCH